MGFNATTSLHGMCSNGPIATISMKISSYDQMELCDIMNEDFVVPQNLIAHGAKSEKYVV